MPEVDTMLGLNLAPGAVLNFTLGLEDCGSLKTAMGK